MCSTCIPPLAEPPLLLEMPETELPKLAIGDEVKVTCDNCSADLTAKNYFIATSAEYTPPVIYSLDERNKLVYLIQARPNRPDSLRVGQPIREIGPAHAAKAGTPTMGGLLILLSLGISVLLWTDLSNPFVWIVLGLTAGYGVLGFIDDYAKVTKKSSAGISARAKLFWQVLLAFGVAIAIYTSPAFDGELAVPFFKNFTPNIGWLYVPLATFIIVAASNSVNLTDGLDGLAIGPVMISAGTFLLLAYASGHAGIAEYLQIKNVPGAGQLAIFCGALVGGGLGFLWFNASPAELFMGDVGSLALGGALVPNSQVQNDTFQAKICYVTDPDGHVIELCSLPPSAV